MWETRGPTPLRNGGLPRESWVMGRARDPREVWQPYTVLLSDSHSAQASPRTRVELLEVKDRIRPLEALSLVWGCLA